MFPLRWNFPFRKKDGSLVKLEDAMGGDYSLPTASASTKGGVKVGHGLSMDEEVLNRNDELPEYSSSESGKVLGVDSEGALEWKEAGGGGGSDLYLDVETNCSLTMNGWQANYFDTSSLSGKTITGWVVQQAPSNTQYYVASGMMNPGGQTSMFIYTSQGTSPRKITIRFYYK